MTTEKTAAIRAATAIVTGTVLSSIGVTIEGHSPYICIAMGFGGLAGIAALLIYLKPGAK